jgi:SAM-dependent methyltransferase
MHDSSSALVDRLGLRNGLVCLDAGCGGGDVTLELARRVAPDGKALGVDIDEAKLQVARTEARERGIANVEFRASDLRGTSTTETFDAVYSRFLLTHLRDPASVVRAFHACLRPGGMLGVEDVDFSGHFAYPESRAFRRYHELYCATVARRGGDPNIGPRLPALLKQSGFVDVRVAIVQPAATQGEAKLMDPLTMENIAGAVLADGLASQAEIDQLVRELYEFAVDPDTLAGTPRIFQVWGRRA